MATTKKTTTKKAPAKKASVAKKPAAKAPAKKVTKAVSKPAKRTSRSFVAMQPETEDFMTFRINRETVYWAVLGAVVILFGLWIMQLQADIQSIYDDIDATTSETSATSGL